MSPRLVDTSADAPRTIAELQQQLGEMRRELDERAAERDAALAREAATAEVLQLINSSPGDLAPVFNAVVEKAMRLCDATQGALGLWQDERFSFVSTRGMHPRLVGYLSANEVQIGSQNAFARVAQGAGFVQHVDLAASALYRSGEPFTRALVDLSNTHTALNVPLIRDDEPIGVIALARDRVEPFTEQQINLVRTFAAQAVVAMENARLLGQLRQRTSDLEESLEYQTATSEVLKALSRSTFDLEAILQTVVEAAHRLCRSDYSVIFRNETGEYRFAAGYGNRPEYEESERQAVIRPGRGTIVGRAALEGCAVQIKDALTDPEYEDKEAARINGAHSMLGVPLLREGQVIGAFGLARNRVEPFSHREVELMTTFADQAAIAIDNARLLTETREALEQQTATAEVLGVINSSPGDLAPVWGAMLEKAVRLCEAHTGHLFRFENGAFFRLASHGVSEDFDKLFSRETPVPLNPNSIPARMIATRSIVHVRDQREDESYRLRLDRDVVGAVGAGILTVLFVPLIKEGEVVGHFTMHRMEVKPFSDKQIALIQNFAAQAVIAMENARLLTETREALEQQTATAEVLQVINSSPGNLTPVFDVICEQAMRLCDTAFGGLGVWRGDRFEYVSTLGALDRDELNASQLSPGSRRAFSRVAQGRGYIHFSDISASDLYERGDPAVRTVVDIGGARSLLNVPLAKGDEALGLLMLYRREVRPFSDREIALVQNFAAQAVIAMENARLLTETREALEQQTATAEVLQVINSSPGDLAPVFDAVLGKAMRLCEASFGVMALYDGEYLRATAMCGVPRALVEFMSQPQQPTPSNAFYRLVEGEDVVQIDDVADSDAYRSGSSLRRALVNLGGARTALWVALRNDEKLLGDFVLYRQEVRPFTDKQITLLQNFAAQAVIAIENARLLGELRERTRDLEESLEYQTATSDVLKVISRSTFDLQPVLQTLLDTAMRLCGNSRGEIFRLEGDVYRMAVSVGLEPAYRDIEASLSINPGDDTLVGRTVLARRPVQIVDPYADPTYAPKDDAQVGQLGTMLGVPLLRGGIPVGVICTARRTVEPFSERQIELVRTFADQAVIAIENARLLTETREALEQQTATAEVLGVINSSPGDLPPVFETILQKAHLLCGATLGTLFLYDGAKMSAMATFGYPEDVAAVLRNGILPPPPLLDGARLVHRQDIREAADEDIRAGADEVVRLISQRGGVRTNLIIPLRKDGLLQGMISCNRQEVRPYTDKQIALLENFAAQAVIAIDNARLLDEIRQRQAELRVTFDNMGDGVAMFDADLRLAAWNRNFQQILDVPDAVLAPRPGYEDYLRFLAGRGEFGTEDAEAELRWRLDRTDEEIRFERSRPDGRVIEVRRNAVPGGGFVLIYGDITERKAAEAEIHAARDAAEKALAELSATQQQLVVQQKMAALGQLTAGIAHEIKNPLNFVNNFAGLSNELLAELKETAAPAWEMLDTEKRAEIDETIEMLSGNLAKIAEHGRRADGIVKSMLDHSRGSSAERRSVDLNALVEEALNLAYHGVRAQNQNFNITLERDLDAGLAPIELVPQDVTRVFLNVIGNGFYAANKRREQGDDPAFRPVFRVTTRETDGGVEVRLRDNGIGIRSEHRDRLFQPFFTTKPTGEGTGLGLSISYDIVTQQHGGTIEVDSEPGEFTEFIIRLPRQAQRANGRAA